MIAAQAKRPWKLEVADQRGEDAGRSSATPVSRVGARSPRTPMPAVTSDPGQGAGSAALVRSENPWVV